MQIPDSNPELAVVIGQVLGHPLGERRDQDPLLFFDALSDLGEKVVDLAGGSVAWGLVADWIGVGTALLASAGWTAVALVSAVRYRLPDGPPPDVEPSRHWPEAPAVPDPDAGGPVLVQIEYRVQPADAAAFRAAATILRTARLRDGAVRWDLFADAEDAGRYVESFLVESWAEHLRQHGRHTVEDRVAEDRVRAFHGETLPRPCRT